MLRHRLPVTLTALLVLVLLANCGAAPEPEVIVEKVVGGSCRSLGGDSRRGGSRRG